MLWFWIKIAIAASLIAISSSFAEKRPALAGFLIALPLSSMLALAFTYLKTKDTEVASQFGRAILTGVPISLLFFVPFVFAERLKWSFGWLYVFGLCLLAIGYLVQQRIWNS